MHGEIKELPAAGRMQFILQRELRPRGARGGFGPRTVGQGASCDRRLITRCCAS